MKNILTSLAKSVPFPLALTAASAASNVVVHKKNLFSGAHGGFGTETLIILKKEMNDLMKTFKSLQNLGILLKTIEHNIKVKTAENETKEQNGEFLAYY